MSVPGGPEYPPPPTGPGGYPPPPPIPSGPGTLAEWWRRAVAIILDALIVGIPMSILGAIIGLADVISDTAEGRTVRYEARPGLALLSFLASLAYFGLLEGGERGASLGKMALRIQVRDASVGGPIGVGRAVLRRFVYLILFYALFIPGLINVLSPLWDRRRQAWHDKAASTVVVNTA